MTTKQAQLETESRIISDAIGSDLCSREEITQTSVVESLSSATHEQKSRQVQRVTLSSVCHMTQITSHMTRTHPLIKLDNSLSQVPIMSNMESMEIAE